MAARTTICLTVVIGANAFGNISLGYGMRQEGDIASFSPLELFRSGVAAMGNPWVLLGVVLLVVYFAAHTLVLSWADLSYVLLITSSGYILTAALSGLILGERVSCSRWAGTLLVAAGAALVGSTAASTAASADGERG